MELDTTNNGRSISFIFNIISNIYLLYFPLNTEKNYLRFVLLTNIIKVLVSRGDVYIPASTNATR